MKKGIASQIAADPRRALRKLASVAALLLPTQEKADKGIGSEFMRKTRFRYLAANEQLRGVPRPPPVHPAWDTGTAIPLPPPGSVHADQVDLYSLVTRRTSLRKCADAPLSLDELSFLLWCTQGVKSVSEEGMVRRTVPSAAARHAFETTLLVNRVTGLEPGLYRYRPLAHQLTPWRIDEGMAGKIANACPGQEFIRRAAATFIWVAIPYRMTWRCGERGYRYLNLEAGHVCQNLYLAAEAIGGGACAVAAFHDDALNSFLELDGEEAFVIYLATVGKRPAGKVEN